MDPKRRRRRSPLTKRRKGRRYHTAGPRPLNPNVRRYRPQTGHPFNQEAPLHGTSTEAVEDLSGRCQSRQTRLKPCAPARAA